MFCIVWYFACMSGTLNFGHLNEEYVMMKEILSAFSNTPEISQKSFDLMTIHFSSDRQ